MREQEAFSILLLRVALRLLGGGWGGGVRASHSSQGVAPAPPPTARVLHVATGTETVDVDLRP